MNVHVLNQYPTVRHIVFALPCGQDGGNGDGGGRRPHHRLGRRRLLLQLLLI
jgi:hypothetical protein